MLSHRELVEELKTMSGAAIGTSTDLMSIFLLVVALLPDIQDKVVKVSRTRAEARAAG